MVQSSLRMIEEAGIGAIAAKAQLGTELMLALFDAWLVPLGFSLITPRNADRRGGHISIVHTDAKKIAAALRTMKNVVPDFRTPSGIRLAIAPLPTSFTEVYDGFARLRDLVESRDYLKLQDNGSRVT
jgi:kynureninase